MGIAPPHILFRPPQKEIAVADLAMPETAKEKRVVTKKKGRSRSDEGIDEPHADAAEMDATDRPRVPTRTVSGDPDLGTSGAGGPAAPPRQLRASFDADPRDGDPERERVTRK